MSAWPIPDEVVEEFARIVCVNRYGPVQSTWPRGAHDDARTVGRIFLERHRLVVLPEKPMEWEVEQDFGDHDLYWTIVDDEATARECATVYETPTGRIRPRYAIPGQPITVGKEESDDQA